MNKPKLSKKERRQQRLRVVNQEEGVAFKPILNIKKFQPLTDNQAVTFDAFASGKNLMLHGVAGAGKTFLAMYMSLKEILCEFNQYDKLIIVRSVVPTRDMGFLPGKQGEKAEVYEAPYSAICTELFGRGDAYHYLKQKNIIQFTTTSFIRGITLSDAVIIIDEMQNMTAAELNSVITRIGKNCRVIFCGDIAQTDLLNPKKEKTGLGDFIKIIDEMNCFEFIEFEEKDIVRSGLVRDYIITRTKLERSGTIERLTTL
jgi:phosphate starvation-inducible protein PhoH